MKQSCQFCSAPTDANGKYREPTPVERVARREKEEAAQGIRDAEQRAAAAKLAEDDSEVIDREAKKRSQRNGTAYPDEVRQILSERQQRAQAVHDAVLRGDEFTVDSRDAATGEQRSLRDVSVVDRDRARAEAARLLALRERQRRGEWPLL
jgi:hypothetical protein